MPMTPWPALEPFGKYLALPKGRRLFYYDVPPAAAMEKPKKPVLLIHGLGDEADTWRHLVPRLCASGRRVLALDLPGFGRSTPAKKISFRGHARAVIALLTGAAAAPAVLAGNSMGAMVAQEAAALRPDLAAALALIDGCFPLGRQHPGSVIAALPGIGPRWYRAFRGRPDAAWRSLALYYTDQDALDAADQAFLRERVMARVESESQERAYFASFRSLIRLYLIGKPAFVRRFRRYTGKILLIWGEKDRCLPRGQTFNLRTLRPDAEYREISGAGHLPHQEKPEETARILLDFLEEGGF